jgi:RNA polymerase sigma factor (sigma-70 family)
LLKEERRPIMSDNTVVDLQRLLDGMRRGDPQARRQILERAYERLRKLAGRSFASSFPALRNRHELDSVVHESWLRLMQALEKTEPPTVADFFRLVAHKVRQVLLDMVERERRRQGREALGVMEGSASEHSQQPSDLTYEPTRLALWTELHDKVATLPEQERAVFEMHYYLDMPQIEIARMLGLHPRKVSYLWVAATVKLTKELSRAEGLL